MSRSQYCLISFLKTVFPCQPFYKGFSLLSPHSGEKMLIYIKIVEVVFDIAHYFNFNNQPPKLQPQKSVCIKFEI